MEKKIDVCVVGLGYVGLPLAVELAKHFRQAEAIAARLHAKLKFDFELAI
jgi:UDP-N-acetyl-D-mannosaminuronate dehydrogenase